MVEQEFNARRVEELRLDRVAAREQATACAFREAVLAVATEAGMPERLHAMRAASRAAAGAPAADIIEARLS